ncbi:MAG: hypothetical protein LBG61_00860 [Burkholderiales bacterium]|jgi:Tfp pilus assembly protein PilX|nr:hypothetical protein [Burkholderiales bacterium]
MRTHHNFYGRTKERGVVLIITMLILTAMLFIASAVMRSSDTSVFAVNNMAFRQCAESSMHFAIEDAMNKIAGAFKVDPYLDKEIHANGIPNVSLNRLPTNEDGIPKVLTGESAGDAAVLKQEVDSCNVRLSYTVEQMCDGLEKMPPTADKCVFSTTEGGVSEDGWIPVIDGEQGFGLAKTHSNPVYRVTVRADGPKNTVVYAQAFLHF